MLRVGYMSPGAKLRESPPGSHDGHGLQVDVDADGKRAADEGISGEGVLRLFGRFEPLHLPLSSARWQEQLHIPQAEAEHVVQPDSVADDLGGESVAVVGMV